MHFCWRYHITLCHFCCYYLKHHCTSKIRTLVPLASRVLEHIAEFARFHTLVPLAHSLHGRTDVLDVI
jgi:hypothetical protein